MKRGDILLFNPGDNHACVQSDERTLDYRSLNITKDVLMDKWRIRVFSTEAEARKML